jgi:hypothetical protein
MELVRFDMQLLENAEISGIEYQQGTLFGYEVREYLLEKWGRKCAYCGKTGVPLEIEHIVPRARGGSQRVSNLTLACEPCNTKKGTQTAGEFGHPAVQAQAKRPRHDAAAVNATRWALSRRLKATGLPVETGTGAYEMEPHPAPASQNPLARCGQRWRQHARGVACQGSGSPADHRQRVAAAANVPDGQTWLSSHQSQAAEPGPRLSDGGHRAGSGHGRH